MNGTANCTERICLFFVAFVAFVSICCRPCLCASVNPAPSHTSDAEAEAATAKELEVQVGTGPIVTLQEALDESLLQGPRAAAARAKLGISRAGYAQALVLPNPSVEGDYSKVEATYRTGINQQIEPPWKLAFRLLAAKREVDKAMAQIGQALWTLRADIRRLYTDFAIAGETAIMTDQFADLTESLADAARKRFQTGDTPKLDVYRADLAMHQAQILENQAYRRVIQAREQLNIIMGQPRTNLLKTPRLATFKLYARKNNLLPDLSQPLPPLSMFVSEAMRSRFEIKVVRTTLKAEQAHLLTAYGNVVPNPQFATGSSHVTGPSAHGLYLTFNVPLPLFNWQQGEIALRRANIKQLKYELGAQENIVQSQVALAYRKVWNAREKIRTYEETVLAESNKVAELGRISYQLGQTDITGALTSQQSNIQVRQQFLSTVSEYQQAFTDLEQAVGHPIE